MLDGKSNLMFIKHLIEFVCKEKAKLSDNLLDKRKTVFIIFILDTMLSDRLSNKKSISQ